MRTGVDDDLPAYTAEDPRQATLDPKDLQGNTLESMETDDLEQDEGICGMGNIFGYGGQSRASNWSFEGLGDPYRVINATPTSEVDEDLFAEENSSTKVANSSMSDDEGGNRLLADFGNDEGTTYDAYGTPPEQDTVPLLDVPPLQEVEEAPVVDVVVSDDGGNKMD